MLGGLLGGAGGGGIAGMLPGAAAMRGVQQMTGKSPGEFLEGIGAGGLAGLVGGGAAEGGDKDPRIAAFEEYMKKPRRAFEPGATEFLTAGPAAPAQTVGS